MTTSALAPRRLYPVLPAGAGGLAAAGTVLLAQLVALDVRRVKKRIGQLDPAEYRPIVSGLRALFTL